MNLFNDDCIEVLKKLKDNSIDMVLNDPPYGKFTSKKTELKENRKIITWDSGLNWDEILPILYKKVKPNAAIVMFAQAPFTYILYDKFIQHGFEWKYNWIWNKNNGANFASAKYGPLKVYEEILVFYKKGKSTDPKMIYNHGAVINEKLSKKYKCQFYDKKTKQKIDSEYIFDNIFLNKQILKKIATLPINTNENNNGSFYRGTSLDNILYYCQTHGEISQSTLKITALLSNILYNCPMGGHRGLKPSAFQTHTILSSIIDPNNIQILSLSCNGNTRIAKYQSK